MDIVSQLKTKVKIIQVVLFKEIQPHKTLKQLKYSKHLIHWKGRLQYLKTNSMTSFQAEVCRCILGLYIVFWIILELLSCLGYYDFSIDCLVLLGFQLPVTCSTRVKLSS